MAARILHALKRWQSAFYLVLGLTMAAPLVAQETGPSWKDLSSGQQQLLAPFSKQWDGWRPEEKRVWLSLYHRFPNLTPANKEKARKRIAQWARLSPKQRAIARQNYRLAREKRRAERMDEWKRYQKMTKEQKSILRRSSTGAGTRSGLAPQPAQPFK